MLEDSDMACCGIREMNGLGPAKDTLLEMCREITDDNEITWPRFRYAIFSDTFRKNSSGMQLERYIAKNNLGSVVSTGWNRNPNSGNRLKVWMWTLNSKNLRSWWKKNMTQEDKENYAE